MTAGRGVRDAPSPAALPHLPADRPGPHLPSRTIMGSLRRAVEHNLEDRHHTTFIVWAMRRMADGASLRTLSVELTQMVGFPVSHETIRQWVVDG